MKIESSIFFFFFAFRFIPEEVDVWFLLFPRDVLKQIKLKIQLCQNAFLVKSLDDGTYATVYYFLLYVFSIKDKIQTHHLFNMVTFSLLLYLFRLNYKWEQFIIQFLIQMLMYQYFLSPPCFWNNMVVVLTKM